MDEVDKELVQRGHAFVRYTDDLNVYVRTQRSGERVMQSMRKLFAKLKLRVNETKSKVKRATQSKFLGFSFWVAGGRSIRRRVAPQAVQLKHWKRGSVIYRELVARGMSHQAAKRVAANSSRWWHNSAMSLHIALPNRFFDKLGLPRLAS